MKRTTGVLSVLILAALAAGSARAAVTLNLTLGVMYSNTSPPPSTALTDGRLIQIIVSSTDTFFGSASSTGWSNGSTGGVDDIIVASFPVNSATSGFPGVTVAAISFAFTGGIGTGDAMMVRWFRDIGMTATAGDVGGWYGTYRNPAGEMGGVAWVVPADGGTYDMNFYTASLGGANPESAGMTNMPEPTTYALIFGLAALGAACFHRRKKAGAATVN